MSFESSYKINYVIATHALNTFRRKNLSGDKYTTFVLRYHMYILSKNISSNSNIKQITIVKPDVPDEIGYYNLSPYDKILEEKGVNIIYYDVENKGGSYTQYLKCFQKYPDFDYYIIMEDDWTVNIKYEDFDKILIDLYHKTFLNNIGFLNCWSPKSGKFVQRGGFGSHGFHSAITLGILSNSTVISLLNNLTNFTLISQMEFSVELLNRSIPIVDLIQAGFSTKIYFWETIEGLIKDYSETDATDVFFTPIQYYYDSVIIQNKLTDNVSEITNNFGIHNV